MNTEIEKRLAELKGEHDAGQNQLRHLEARSHQLRETMLRISGAITVLEEILEERRRSTG